jgi:hypothetical protein
MKQVFEVKSRKKCQCYDQQVISQWSFHLWYVSKNHFILPDYGELITLKHVEVWWSENNRVKVHEGGQYIRTLYAMKCLF